MKMELKMKVKMKPPTVAKLVRVLQNRTAEETLVELDAHKV
jgi:hypothetical protein